MNTHLKIAVLCLCAIPMTVLAQAPETRIVQTNQIPENPAKIIEVVGAPEPDRTVVAAPVPASEDVVVRRNRTLMPVPALGAPIARERIVEQERAREEVIREEIEGKHLHHK